MKTAVIAGATGLVGRELLSLLLGSDRYGSVVALTRKPLDIDHPRLRTLITDFKDLEKVLSGTRPDDVFCCLGTTMAKAGSREKFFQADFEFPFALAKATLSLGAKQYLLVSALGADTRSSIYYNRVKGQVEEAIRALDFNAIHIFRPSLLLGRRSEKRAGEEVAKIFFRIFSFAVPEKYKAVSAGKVASAMLNLAAKDNTGTYIHESNAIQKL